tara:strand:+ start:424 stop:825 length:402 start_codon:yes stop_codon:yes gene_type:complete
LKQKKIKGFTLIELLIVIVILGLLMSLVAPTMFSKVDSTKVKTARAQMQMISTALDTYRLDVGDYPADLDQLLESSVFGWDGPYMPKRIPEDPWGRPYHYEYSPSSEQQYRLQSFGKDGQIGGEGVAADVVHS